MALIALRDYLADRGGARATSGTVTLGQQGAPQAAPRPAPVSSPSAGVDPDTLANLSRAALAARLGSLGTKAGGAGQVGATLGAAGSGASLIQTLLNSRRPTGSRVLGATGDVLGLTSNLAQLDAARSLVPSLATLSDPLFRVGGGFPIDAGVGAGLGPGFEAAGLSEGVGISPIGAAGSALAIGKGIYDFTQGDDVGGTMSLLSAVPFFAPFVAGAQISHGLASGRPKALARAVKNAKQDMGTLSTIVQTLKGVKSENDLLTAIRTPLPELADTATLGMVLKTFGEQNLKGDYADLGWDPNPKLRAAVAFLESLGVPTMPGSAFNKEGGPPPNPFYPETPAFHSLFQNTAVPYGVQGVKLNERDARQTWEPIIGALADLAIRVDPRFATMGPEPISREALNERLALGRFTDVAGMPQSSPEQGQAMRQAAAAAIQKALTTRDVLPPEMTRTAPFGPEHLEQRAREFYQAQTGQPVPSAPSEADRVEAEEIARRYWDDYSQGE